MGTAIPSQFNFPRVALKQKMFILGQAKITDYVIQKSDKGGSKWLSVVSKWQCKIVMNVTEVFVREKSSNGFWGNRKKVGKDNMWPLEHYSEIFF